MIKFKCIKCGKKIHRHSFLYRTKKCRSCSHKGKKNRNYKHGKNCQDNMPKCMDCNKKIINIYAKRCQSCNSKYLYKTGILNNSGKNNPNYKDGRVNQTYNCLSCGKKLKGRNAYKSKRCKSCANKIITIQRWKKSRNKMSRAILKGLRLHPNKPEKKLSAILNNLFPNNYKFVGNGKLILDGFCPDFVNCNGQKKIIELYGDYWHNLLKFKKRDILRLQIYKKYGYKTLIIWEHELKNRKKLKQKIKEFNNARP